MLFPIVPSSSSNKVTEVGTLGPVVASLWYEESQPPFQSLRKLGTPQSQACQFLTLGWESPQHQDWKRTHFPQGHRLQMLF